MCVVVCACVDSDSELNADSDSDTAARSQTVTSDRRPWISDVGPVTVDRSHRISDCGSRTGDLGPLPRRISEDIWDSKIFARIGAKNSAQTMASSSCASGAVPQRANNSDEKELCPRQCLCWGRFAVLDTAVVCMLLDNRGHSWIRAY